MAAHVDQLRRIASAVREILEHHAGETTDIMFRDFPRGTCGPTSELLGRYLTEAAGLDAQYIAANRSDGWSHAWVTVDGIIIDITADQFGQEPIIVAANSDWHGQWEADEPRPPICSHAQWPDYPFAAWSAIHEGMVLRGFWLRQALPGEAIR
jgi:hypothetical protein